MHFGVKMKTPSALPESTSKDVPPPTRIGSRAPELEGARDPAHLTLERAEFDRAQHPPQHCCRSLPRLGGGVGGPDRVRVGAAVRPLPLGYERGW